MRLLQSTMSLRHLVMRLLKRTPSLSHLVMRLLERTFMMSSLVVHLLMTLMMTCLVLHLLVTIRSRMVLKNLIRTMMRVKESRVSLSLMVHLYPTNLCVAPPPQPKKRILLSPPPDITGRYTQPTIRARYSHNYLDLYHDFPLLRVGHGEVQQRKSAMNFLHYEGTPLGPKRAANLETSDRTHPVTTVYLDHTDLFSLAGHLWSSGGPQCWDVGKILITRFVELGSLYSKPTQ